jgi:hypothetical protein
MFRFLYYFTYFLAALDFVLSVFMAYRAVDNFTSGHAGTGWHDALIGLFGMAVGVYIICSTRRSVAKYGRY